LALPKALALPESPQLINAHSNNYAPDVTSEIGSAYASIDIIAEFIEIVNIFIR
jgi:hypothetical protein